MRYFNDIPKDIEDAMSFDEKFAVGLKKQTRIQHIFTEKKKLYPSEGIVKLHLTRYFIGTDDDL